MFKRYKEKKLGKKLETLYQVATRRRDGQFQAHVPQPFLEGHSFYDYLNADEQKQYSILAEEHFYLCQNLGESSKYFSKHRDPLKGEPNSPHAFLAVSNNASKKIDHEVDEDGKTWMRVGGERKSSPEPDFSNYWRLTDEEKARRDRTRELLEDIDKRQ